MSRAPRRSIVVLPTNGESEWFRETLSPLGEVSFVIDEKDLSLHAPPSQEVRARVESADLVVYRRMRAQRLYPTRAPYLCVELTPLRHPCTWGHYFVDPQGFFHEGEAVSRFRALESGAQASYSAAGRRIQALYHNAVHAETVELLRSVLQRRRRRPLLAAVILQVPEDDTILFGSDYGDDPHRALIAYAKEMLQDCADLVIKPHPVHPRLTRGGTESAAGAIVVDEYCPVWALMHFADVVVTINSSCALEALILGTPAVVLGRCLPADLGLAWTPVNFRPGPLPPGHTEAWRQLGEAFTGFLAEDYGFWYPSPHRLFAAASALLAGGPGP